VQSRCGSLTTFPADTPKRALVAAGAMQRAARVLTQPKSSYVTPPQVKFLSTVLEGLMPKDRSRSNASPAKSAAAAEAESKEEFFEGLGNIAEAPKYLRINGKVGERTRWQSVTKALRV
jgi:hypothetical protein